MADWFKQNSDWLVSVSTTISALAAVVSVFFACLTVMESVRLRKVETEPEVAIYLDRPHGGDVLLVIKNIGGGSAYDLSFDVNDFLFEGAYFVGKDDPLLKEIRYLAPNQEVRALFDAPAQGDQGGPSISITVRYTTRSRRRQLSETFPLTTRSIYLQNSEPNIQARQLYEINQSLQQIHTSLKSIKH